MSTAGCGGGGGGEVEAKRVFIGAGCNRVVNNVSWGACGLVSFGAQNAVAIFCPEVVSLTHLLLWSSTALCTNHKKRFFFFFFFF